MAYTSQSQIQLYIPLPQLTAALDDQNSGLLDTGLLATIIAQVSADINGRIGNICNTPFSDPAPQRIQAAATLLACEAIFQRRLTAEEKNLFKSQADEYRSQLAMIGRGEIGLDLDMPRAFVPGFVAQEYLAMDCSTL